MVQANKYLKDKDNRTIIPYTHPDNVIFDDKELLTKKLSDIIDAITKLTNDKVSSETLALLEIELRALIDGKVDKIDYISTIEGILARLVLLEADDGGGGGDIVIPPNLIAMLDELRSRIESLEIEVVYTSSVPSTQTVGGIEKGFITDGTSINDMFYNLLHPYAAPIIESSVSCDTILEEGTTINNVTFSLVATPSSTPITRVDLIKDGAVIDSSSYSSTDINIVNDVYVVSGISESTILRFKVTDNNMENTSSPIVLTFVKPLYVGTIDDIPTTQAQIKALAKRVVLQGEHSLVVNASDKPICICVPNNQTLESIYDPNGFDIKKSFATSNVAVGTTMYSVYASNKVTVNNFKVTFRSREV